MRLSFVITFAEDISLANSVSSIFSSSIPVSGTNESAYSKPASFKSSPSVPSPLIIIALGSSTLSSSQRLRLLSIIFTDIPAEISCFAR